MRREFRYGKRIQELRQEHAWTQEQLAAAAELEVRTIQRAEKDKTQCAETLQAIAGAFDVELSAMRTTRFTPEHRLLRAELVTSYEEFVALEVARGREAFAKTIMVPVQEKRYAEIEELWELIFADRELIEPDEPELWNSYVTYIKEPMTQLFDMRLAIFTVDEFREALPSPESHSMPDSPANGLTVRHHVAVPRHGCYQTKIGQFHRFDVSCVGGYREFLKSLRKGIEPVLICHNAVFPLERPNGEPEIRWCSHCFPTTDTGGHISEDYVASVLGLSIPELRKATAIFSEMAGDDSLLGLS